MTRDDYLAHLQSLLPSGPVWSREPGSALVRLLDAMAAELAQVDRRAGRLLEEADPRTTVEMLADWERVCGLPDTCSIELGATLQERRAAVVAKWTGRGGQSRTYFTGLAARLGYAITIDEYRPFIAGVSRCGDRLNGAPSVRLVWRVRVHGPRYTAFRTGASRTGDRLGKITQAEDLECLIKRLAPAHTTLIFAYEGA